MAKNSWVGEMVGGRYTIESLLGQGGMSSVYKGTDPNLRRPVAVKLIHSHLASDKEFVRRFEEEAAAVARLRHPHIIQVFDFNHDGDTYYMVLEYVEGQTLEEYLQQLTEKGEMMGIEQVRQVMSKLCTAVGYAHQQGMIHRDLKPANVMIRPDGTPLLMDFGIVKMVEGANHTATGAVMGTIAYMSPEQIQGKRPDHRADLYSLGVILYEMVTGERPFMGENTASTLMMHLTQPVPDLRERALPSFDTVVLGRLAEVIETAMAKDPDDRYQSAEEMVAALEGTPPTKKPAFTSLPSPTAETLTQEEPHDHTIIGTASPTLPPLLFPPPPSPQSLRRPPSPFPPPPPVGYAGQVRLSSACSPFWASGACWATTTKMRWGDYHPYLPPPRPS